MRPAGELLNACGVASEPGPDTDLALLRQGWATVTVLCGLCESDDALDLSALD